MRHAPRQQLDKVPRWLEPRVISYWEAQDRTIGARQGNRKQQG